MKQLHVGILAAERGQVKILVGGAEQLGGLVAGVGVQDGVAVAPAASCRVRAGTKGSSPGSADRAQAA